MFDMVKINKNLKGIRLGKNQKKIAILLLGGIALSLSATPKKQFKILGEIHDELKDIDERFLKRSIKALYESKVIDYKENKNGTMTIILSDEGKKRVLAYDLTNMKIKKPNKWDKKWRIVSFDIPENKKIIRRSLNHHFRKIGFYNFQKSIYVYPYDCKSEIDYIIEVYNAREFVRFIVAEYVDNALHLKKIFNLEE
ncbi:hypothetical protein A2996_02085 [Candidatus Campbellbacteria bacterium RIFCSPLOWO2_01_FULL_34_15]|jgi:DNA-binding transcriptional regulator PaaX|uniref:Transcriptional repressor PaaX-like central Cas2-like domain-containing protein n=2 Tax=Candidatus Campbelliibacteriota TaxID=1752727 RepID=A0A1F5EM69_9BACT|nr:MAG: hypothetical protein A2811_00960 [Candidatus Campbellbacteria bacterium RIFCSPHIGHO2_01_FULL_34_10]OGD68498.1 MAG: hypothetical protein A2996_02085 [Candidatus Campbellbacteria bacterium RIFCSPLOWO2_01_FULL_34_15]